MILWLTLCIKLLENWNASLRQHQREGFEDALGKIAVDISRCSKPESFFSERPSLPIRVKLLRTIAQHFGKARRLWGSLGTNPKNFGHPFPRTAVHVPLQSGETLREPSEQIGGTWGTFPENPSKEHEFSLGPNNLRESGGTVKEVIRGTLRSWKPFYETQCKKSHKVQQSRTLGLIMNTVIMKN